MTKRVLLTGATGFVGGQLLIRMLARTDWHLVCPARADSAAGARARGAETLTELLGRTPTAEERSRVRWIRADLEERRLGIDRRTWNQLAAEITDIYHCAASTRFDLPLDEAQRVNVDGVRHVFELARDAGDRFHRFHHVSTAYVSGHRSGVVSADHLPSDRERNFRNTYERTKARAERFLRSQDDVHVTIYRPSIVAGDTTTGRTTNWNVLYGPMKMIVRGQLPFLRCGGPALLDTVGVDYVADAMLVLSQRITKHGTGYHLTAGLEPFDLPTYVRTCLAAATFAGEDSDCKLVSPLGWRARVLAFAGMARLPKACGRPRRLGRLASRGLASFSPYAPYTSVAVRFDDTLEREVLAAAGVVMPPAREYLGTIVAWAVRHDFGKVASPPSPVEGHMLTAERGVSSTGAGLVEVAS